MIEVLLRNINITFIQPCLCLFDKFNKFTVQCVAKYTDTYVHTQTHTVTRVRTHARTHSHVHGQRVSALHVNEARIHDTMSCIYGKLRVSHLPVNAGPAAIAVTGRPTTVSFIATSL